MNSRMRCTVLSLALGGVVGVVAVSAGQLQYVGVNLSVAEFGQSNLPGTFNTHYRYPTQTEVEYFRSKCMNTIRLPFRWERLQQSANAALDATELSRMDAFVNGATAKGMYVLIEPHNFARYYPDPGNFQSSAQGLIGTDVNVPYSAFGDFWSRVSDHYKNNPRVIFDLMNEPNTMATENWVTAANTAIAAIRATGATNPILVPGNGWGGAHSWMQNWYGTANGVALLNIVDSGNNVAFEAHQYLDSNSSGTSATIVSETIGAERMVPFTNWLIANNKKGFLGEFAVANSTIGAGIGDEAINNMLQHVEDNSDVYLGWAWWAAGPWWGNYMFTLEPTNIGQPSQADREVMGVLRDRIGPFPTIVTAVSPSQYEFVGLVDYIYQPQIATDLVLSNWTDNGSTMLGTGGTSSVPVSGSAAEFHRICATCPDQ